MSRRVLTPPVGVLPKAQERMAPGGRRWSESPVRPMTQLVGEAGSITGAATTEEASDGSQ